MVGVRSAVVLQDGRVEPRIGVDLVARRTYPKVDVAELVSTLFVVAQPIDGQIKV